MRTLCSLIFVEDIAVNTSNRSNICAGNFTKIMRCDSSCSAPGMSYPLLQSNYTLSQDWLPTPIGMNLTLVEKLLQHDELRQLLERIWNNGQKALITAHHDTEEIQDILERVKQDREHHGWETLLGWSPTATGIHTHVLRPVVVVLSLTVLCLLLTIILYIRLWKVIACLESLWELCLKY